MNASLSSRRQVLSHANREGRRQHLISKTEWKHALRQEALKTPVHWRDLWFGHAVRAAKKRGATIKKDNETLSASITEMLSKGHAVHGWSANVEEL